MLQDIIGTLILSYVWFEIYYVYTWNKLLMKKPFGCEMCFPVYAYVLMSFLPIYLKEMVIGAFASVIIFLYILKITRK